jgi:hypothetical protein
MSNTLTMKQRRGHALAFSMFLDGMTLEDFITTVASLRKDSNPREILFSLTTWTKCFQCGSTMELGVNGNDWKGRDYSTIGTRDHLTPQCDVKIHDWSNTVLICQTCNTEKGTRSDWRSFYLRGQLLDAWVDVADEWQADYRDIMRGVKI